MSICVLYVDTIFPTFRPTPFIDFGQKQTYSTNYVSATRIYLMDGGYNTVMCQRTVYLKLKLTLLKLRKSLAIVISTFKKNLQILRVKTNVNFLIQSRPKLIIFQNLKQVCT
jgi:hypothetical protein